MNKARPADIAFNAINYTVFGLIMFLSLYPFYYIFIYSISDSVQAIKGITFYPRGFTLDNYVGIFQQEGIPRAAMISVLRTVTGTMLTVFCSSFFGYLMTKQKMYFRKIIYRFMVITMYISAGLIPWYLTMRMYGFNNNFLVYIMPGALNAFHVILIKTFIEQLPASLEEAAIVDGAGTLMIFTRVIFPLSMPIIATISVFTAVGQWNSWFDNLIFMVGRPDYNTLQIILYNLLRRAGTISSNIDMTSAEQMAKRITPDSIRMTITMVVTFPILFVYPFAQKYFVKGIMIGAIKG
ncbi:MAG: carbohydrate ABC transporter permease [Oscillospiraceae bacterium]|nr:carbohydrate ABC transporter permease [Oscillospiraceae bacterium]